VKALPVLGAIILVAAPPAAAATPKHWHRPIGPCFRVTGRLTIGNGTHAVRIWPRGTHRLLGVVNPDPHKDYDAGEMLPKNVLDAMRFPAHDSVWGRYRVCPISLERAGSMQRVLIRGAHDVIPIDR